MNSKLTINTNNLDISKPADFAAFALQAQELKNQLDAFWGAVEQQMNDRGVNKLKGDWGSVTISPAELLTIVDASQLDPQLTKPALDTKKVHGYVDVFGELPAGVGVRTVTKFTKRIKG